MAMECRYNASLSSKTSVKQANYIALLDQRRAILSSSIKVLIRGERISTLLLGKKKRDQ